MAQGSAARIQFNQIGRAGIFLNYEVQTEESRQTQSPGNSFRSKVHLGVVDHTHDFCRTSLPFGTDYFGANDSHHFSLPAHKGAVRRAPLDIRLNTHRRSMVVPPGAQPEWVTVDDCPLDHSCGSKESADV